jgi:serine/threonine protein kinase
MNIVYRAYGAVFKCKHKETGLVLAIKKVKTPGKKVRDDIKQEIDLLKKCRHINIVSYWGCCFYQQELWVKNRDILVIFL